MKLCKLSVLTFSLIAGISTVAVGQATTSVLTTGLNAPNKIIKAPENTLLIAEGGTAAPNTGRISVADRTSGARHTLIAGLPSALSFLGGNPAGDADGPSGILLKGNALFVTIGVGDAVLPGLLPGLETPNPTPSSPIFNSILEITLPGGFPTLASSFTITPAHQLLLDAGEVVTISNLEDKEIRVRLVADLPDWRPDPRPTAPDNVKASHLYGVEIWGAKKLYVADAGHNNITAVSRFGGETEILTIFPPRPNPIPVGGPFIEAVPDNLHRFGNSLLVPLLTGFPFIVGGSEIRLVQLKGGGSEVLIDGLSSAIDILKAGDDEEELVEQRVEPGASATVKGSGDSLAGPIATEKGSASDSGADLAISDGDAAAKAGKLMIRYTGAPTLLPPGETNAYYTLEFSTDMRNGTPGRLRYYANPTSTPLELVTNLTTPTSMTRDGDNGNIYITSIALGRVIKVVFD